MRLDAASSSSTVTALASIPRTDRSCYRSRSKTDPMVRDSANPPSRTRRPGDIVSPKHKPSGSLQFSGASALSSDSFSNPALAGFSPRKLAVLKSGSRSGTSSSIPTLLLQTPRTARDLDLQSQSSTVQFSSPFSPNTLPSAASSTVSPSESVYPPSTIDSRPSYQKRAPASRSSLGIETSTGPPPALSTQRTLSYERHSFSNLDYSNRPRSFGQSDGRDSESNPRTPTATDVGMRGDLPTSILKRSSLPTRSLYSSHQKDSRSSAVSRTTGYPEDEEEEELTATIDINADVSSRESDDSRQKGEDVFLNIAKSAPNRRSLARSERQSKLGPDIAPRLRTNEDTPSPERLHEPSDMSPLGNPGKGILRYSESNHLDEPGRSKYLGSTSRTTVGIPRGRFGRTNHELSPESPQISERRGSNQDAVQPRAYRQSNRTHRAMSTSDGTDRPKLEAERSRFDGTESTMSTNAPSTVWDELDDLKSRIRKLELTGKLPASSAAAMSSFSGERPRTATTTVTTLSSSPKHGRKPSASPGNGDTSVVDAQIVALLRTGLAKAKRNLSPDIYSTLETTANDALTLASAFGPKTQQFDSSMSVISATTGTDRRFKRKIDNMCRSLTELCIALADDQLTALSNNRPRSRDTSSHVAQLNGIETSPRTAANYRRSVSHEPEDPGRQSSSFSRSLASSRTEGGRRSSIYNLASSTSTVRSSTQQGSESQATIKPSTPVSRIGRSATTNLHSSRRQEEEDMLDRSSSVTRPISRVLTDVVADSNPRTSFLARSSREFSPKQPSFHEEPLHHQPPPPPQQQHHNQLQTPQGTTSTRNTNNTHQPNQSNIPLRRSYLSTGSHLSTTTHLNVQPGYRRYGTSVINNTPTTSSGTNNNERRATLPTDGETASSPLTASTTPGNRTASHFSSMQQLRPRTNSFGRRRLSLRRTKETGGGGGD